MNRLALSFDDSTVEQYKWAHTLADLGLSATFYVSPGALGPWRLQEWMLERMVQWGQVIGSHTWRHESPKQDGWEKTLESIEKAEEWLRVRGFASKLLAVPCGSRGGEWSKEQLVLLRLRGYVVRDVRYKGEGPELGACESTELPFAEPFDSRYFHGNYNTSDDDLAKLFFEAARLVRAGELELVVPRREE